MLNSFLRFLLPKSFWSVIKSKTLPLFLPQRQNVDVFNKQEILLFLCVRNQSSLSLSMLLRLDKDFLISAGGHVNISLTPPYEYVCNFRICVGVFFY